MYGHGEPDEYMDEILPNKVYTLMQTCALLQISEPTMRRWLKLGRVRGAQLGREWRFLGSQILDSLNRVPSNFRKH